MISGMYFFTCCKDWRQVQNVCNLFEVVLSDVVGKLFVGFAAYIISWMRPFVVRTSGWKVGFLSTFFGIMLATAFHTHIHAIVVNFYAC